MNKKRKQEHSAKKCEECENAYFLSRKYSDKQFETSRFCSVGCRNLHKRKYFASIGRTNAKTRRVHAPRPKPINCEACGKDGKLTKKGIVLDHCHKTDKFRGYLCSQCNVALGMLEDSPHRLIALIKYLEINA